MVVPIATRLTAELPAASAVTVHGISPTIWSSKAAIETKTKGLFTVSGAFGLNLAPAKDAAKMVSQSDVCDGAAPSGGTIAITDIGPGDTSGAQTAKLGFTFTASGAYKLCYRPFGKTYRMVGTHLVQVYDAGPVIQGYSPAQGASAVNDTRLRERIDIAKLEAQVRSRDTLLCLYPVPSLGPRPEVCV